MPYTMGEYVYALATVRKTSASAIVKKLLEAELLSLSDEERQAVHAEYERVLRLRARLYRS